MDPVSVIVNFKKDHPDKAKAWEEVLEDLSKEKLEAILKAPEWEFRAIANILKGVAK